MIPFALQPLVFAALLPLSATPNATPVVAITAPAPIEVVAAAPIVEHGAIALRRGHGGARPVGHSGWHGERGREGWRAGWHDGHRFHEQARGWEHGYRR